MEGGNVYERMELIFQEKLITRKLHRRVSVRYKEEVLDTRVNFVKQKWSGLLGFAAEGSYSVFVEAKGEYHTHNKTKGKKDISYINN